MQISTLKISDSLLLSWRKKHLQFWVRPKDCIFFCSLVNRTGEGTAKPSSQHSSTQLNMDLERLKLREQHNQIKNPPCINPERQDHGNSVDTQKYQEVEAQAGRKHPHHAKAKLLPSIAAARGRQMWGKLGATQFMRYSSQIPLKPHGKILFEWKYTLGSKPLCVVGHPHSPPIPC